MACKTNSWFFLFFFLLSIGFAQGDDNLLMQYNKGPDLDAFYRKWNVDLHTQLVYGNVKEDSRAFKIDYAAGAYLQYKFSKTFALVTGADYFNLRYQYQLQTNQSYDRLRYLSIPLTLRVFPSRKLLFETGLLYNHLLKAQNTEIVDLSNSSNIFPPRTFKNTFGWLFAAQYNSWKRLNVSIQYRFFKKASPTLNVQKNNFEAWVLGLHFFVLNPKKKPQ